jgi:hypothetical protein
VNIPNQHCSARQPWLAIPVCISLLLAWLAPPMLSANKVEALPPSEWGWDSYPVSIGHGNASKLVGHVHVLGPLRLTYDIGSGDRLIHLLPTSWLPQKR